MGGFGRPFLFVATSIVTVDSLRRANLYETMEFHCNSIVFTMADKGDLDTKQLSITLPLDAVEMIDNGLIPFGLYGKKLATVCANLILDMLKTQAVQDQIRTGRSKGSA